MSGTEPVREIRSLPHGDGTVDIAILRRRPQGPETRAGVFWMSGFMSDMAGTKAETLDVWAAETGHGCTRFDYSGHGVSGGRIEDSTISQWLSESRAVFATTEGPQIIVGSSMGGYLATLLTLSEREAHGDASRVQALILIAPAIDMTERLMWAEMDEAQRRAAMEDGVYHRPSDYEDGAYPITRALIEDGRAHLLFGSGQLGLGCPVHILQGRRDVDVPLDVSLDLVAAIDGDVTLTVVNSGDHRLSQPGDLDLLRRTVAAAARGRPAP